MDHSVVMAPPSYPYPVPVPIPSAPIPTHPLQPYPFFRNQTPVAVPNHCSGYVAYASPCNPPAEHSSSQRRLLHRHPSSNRSQTSSQQDSKSKSANLQQQSGADKTDDFSDVVTELELKTPGSAGASNSKSAKEQVYLLSRFM